jgi:hypothetical protein
VGLAVAAVALATGGRLRHRSGTIEAWGGAVTWTLRRLVVPRGGADALTLGRVLVARGPIELERWRAHERVHVEQADRWGPLFLPAYLTASAWALARRRDPYLDNRFEREAYRKAGPSAT